MDILTNASSNIYADTKDEKFAPPELLRRMVAAGDLGRKTGRASTATSKRGIQMSERSKDRPWLMRTYAGHSSAAKSNELYRRNLAKGQTGCRSPSTCRPRPATTPDSPLARGEVGKVGVPVAHIGDMRALFTTSRWAR